MHSNLRNAIVEAVKTLINDHQHYVIKVIRVDGGYRVDADLRGTFWLDDQREIVVSYDEPSFTEPITVEQCESCNGEGCDDCWDYEEWFQDEVERRLEEAEM